MTVFYVERLQPHWLENKAQLRFNGGVVALAGALGGALIASGLVALFVWQRSRR